MSGKVTTPYSFDNLRDSCHFGGSGESHVVHGLRPGKRERSVTKKLLHAFVLLAGLSALAAGKDLQNLGGDGVAIQGYDPVAFFADHKPVKGNPQFQSGYHGAKYYFASADHKVAFDRAPAQYEPQFGGYCAYGASRERLSQSRSRRGRSSMDGSSCSTTLV